MVPTAARRAKPVQRSYSQGLQGNPDACHPRRGSACNVTVYKTGGDARLVFANQTQRTAAMGRSPPALLSPHFFGKKCHTVRRYVHPHREGGKPLRPKAHGNRRRPARRPEPP